MDQPQQKPPPPSDGHGPAPARRLLRSLLGGLAALRTENLERRRRLEALTGDIELERANRRQRLEQAKAKLGFPVPAGGAPAAGGKEAGRLSWAAFSPAAWFVIIALAATGILFGPAAVRNLFNIAGDEIPAPPGPAARADSPISGAVAGGAPDGKSGGAAFHARNPAGGAAPRRAGPATPSPVSEKEKESGALALSAAHPVGLAYHNNRWLSVDWMDGRIFELDPAEGFKSPRKFPNPLTTGLSAGSGCLWSTNAFQRRCYKHDPATFAVLSSFPAPGPSPGAVYWDGDSLWLADKKNRLVYRYPDIRRDTAAFVRYPLLEAEPAGLWRTGGLLWVLDRSGKTIRRYRVDKELSPVDMLDISGWLPVNSLPAGLAVAGREIWILAENPSFLYKHRQDRVTWAASPGRKDPVPETAPSRPAEPPAGGAERGTR